MALDPSGARILSGSYDYDVKLWDFGGMGGGTGEAKPFKTWEPSGSYYVSSSVAVIFVSLILDSAGS